jgi:hypothetical protein
MAARSKKKKTSPAKKAKTSKKKKSSSKVQLAATRPPATSAEERFKRDLLVRGEAALPDEHGRLPSEATHEIVEGGEDGELPEIKRRLYKIF